MYRRVSFSSFVAVFFFFFFLSPVGTPCTKRTLDTHYCQNEKGRNRERDARWESNQIAYETRRRGKVLED